MYARGCQYREHDVYALHYIQRNNRDILLKKYRIRVAIAN